VSARPKEEKEFGTRIVIAIIHQKRAMEQLNEETFLGDKQDDAENNMLIEYIKDIHEKSEANYQLEESVIRVFLELNKDVKSCEIDLMQCWFTIDDLFYFLFGKIDMKSNAQLSINDKIYPISNIYDDAKSFLHNNVVISINNFE
jgi:hypothetical protein